MSAEGLVLAYEGDGRACSVTGRLVVTGGREKELRLAVRVPNRKVSRDAPPSMPRSRGGKYTSWIYDIWQTAKNTGQCLSHVDDLRQPGDVDPAVPLQLVAAAVAGGRVTIGRPASWFGPDLI